MRKHLVFLFLIVPIISLGRGLEISEESNVIRQVTTCIFDDFMSGKKELPIMFDDIPTLKDWANRDKYIISFVNRLAIVPSSPTILAEQGVSNKFFNYRLFAISRNISFDKVFSTEGSDRKLGGRHSILIKADNSEIFVMWIPEKEAQIILKQLKDFDPAKQPLAFQGLAHSDAGKAPRQKSPNHNEDLVKGEQHPLLPDQANIKRTLRKPIHSHKFWIIGGIIFLISVIGYAIRRRSYKSS